MDGYLLFAPLLGKNTPTFPKPQDEGTNSKNASEPFMKIDFPRIIGLKIFNSIGVHKYDYLPILFFNLPDSLPLNKYSYRSNESMAPDDYKKGLNSVNKPLLVIVGSNDEAFVASAFKPAVSNNSNGEVIIINGATHNNIIYNKKAMILIKEWLEKFNLTGTKKS